MDFFGFSWHRHFCPIPLCPRIWSFTIDTVFKPSCTNCTVTIKMTKERKSNLYKIILPKLLLLEKDLKKVENLFLQTYLLVIKPVLFRKYIFRYKILCKHVNKIVCGNHNWNRHGHFWIHIYKNKMNQNQMEGDIKDTIKL